MEPDTVDENTAPMTAAERDVLLASSGELSWAGRLRLRRVLSRDKTAQRLAETLALVELVQAGPGAERSHRRPALRFAAALAATLLVAAGAWHWWPGASNPPAPLAEPLSASSARLLLACKLATRPPTVPGRAPVPTSRRSLRSIPMLPGWKLPILQHARLGSPLSDPSR